MTYLFFYFFMTLVDPDPDVTIIRIAFTKAIKHTRLLGEKRSNYSWSLINIMISFACCIICIIIILRYKAFVIQHFQNSWLKSLHFFIVTDFFKKSMNDHVYGLFSSINTNNKITLLSYACLHVAIIISLISFIKYMFRYALI